MKTLFLAVLMTMSMQSFAGQEGGGGDPMEIMAKDFEDVAKLYQVRDFLEEKLKRIDSLNGLDEKIIQELNSLIAARKIKTLPAILILGDQGNIGNYQVPHDADKFVALGGMTNLEVGAPVYLAERVNSYSIEKLSELILHEVSHHVLRDELKFDERFIEKLSDEIMNEKLSPKVATAIEKGYYFTQDKIYAAQLWSALKMDELVSYCENRPGSNFGKNFRNWFAKKGNLAEREIFRSTSEFIVQHDVPVGRCLEDSFTQDVAKRMLNLVREINPNSKFLKNSPLGCSTHMGRWNPYGKCNKSLRFGEVFSGKE